MIFIISFIASGIYYHGSVHCKSADKCEVSYAAISKRAPKAFPGCDNFSILSQSPGNKKAEHKSVELACKDGKLSAKVGKK
jgi:hypothetical protein